jgi:chromosomal replication initiation ATPase DnaA
MDPIIFAGLPERKKHMIVQSIKKVEPQVIIKAVCEALEVTEEQLYSSSRLADIVEARCIAISLILSTNTSITLKKVGKIFNRHYATVIHARDSFQQCMDTSRSFRSKVKLVKNHI